MNNKQIKEQTYKVIAIVFYLIYGISCFVLYYRQSIGFGGKYDSDLMLHIQSGISAKNSYSLSTNLLGILYRITDDTKLVAAFLTLGSLITVAGVYWMFQYLLKRKNIEISSGGLQLCSLLCCFVMSIYVPFFMNIFIWVQ